MEKHEVLEAYRAINNKGNSLAGKTALYEKVLEYWNDKKIVVHRSLKRDMESKISWALHSYTIEEILMAIDHYAIMYYDPDYEYCEYKWTLARLLGMINGMAEFLDDGNKWMSYCRFKEQRKPKEIAKEKLEPEQIASVFSLPRNTTITELYPAFIAALRTMDYKEYIETEHWQHFRKETLKHFHNTCQLCGAKDTTIDVHHKTYINRGRETFNDVIALCRDCHTLYHQMQDKCTCERCAGGEGEHEINKIQ